MYCRDNSDCCNGNCIDSICVRPGWAQNCGLPGEQAEQSWHCCSRSSLEGICLGGNGILAHSGFLCLNDWECFSMSCDRNFCSSRNSSGILGAKCLDDSNCKSKRCKKMCMGSSFDPAPYGFFCENSDECASKMCLNNRCR